MEGLAPGRAKHLSRVSWGRRMVNIFPDAQVGMSREGLRVDVSADAPRERATGMKHDRKADDKTSTQRPTAEDGRAIPVATGATDVETSSPRTGDQSYLSPLHAPTKR